MSGVLAAIAIVAVLAAQARVVTRMRPPSDQVGVDGRAAADASGGAVVGALRRRRWLRRSLSFSSVALMLVAVGMIGYPFYTNLYADRYQDRLDRQFASDELRQAYADGLVEEGDSLTRILIPAIDIDVVVVQGVSPNALRAGAGHYPSTPLPCEAGNVAIAGHRTTYGRPFHDLDQLEPGSEITLITPIGRCTYEVVEERIVVPSDTTVIAATAEPLLTLTTCHPKGSARQRLIIQAARVDAAPPAS